MFCTKSVWNHLKLENIRSHLTQQTWDVEADGGCEVWGMRVNEDSNDRRGSPRLNCMNYYIGGSCSFQIVVKKKSFLWFPFKSLKRGRVGPFPPGCCLNSSRKPSSYNLGAQMGLRCVACSLMPVL